MTVEKFSISIAPEVYAQIDLRANPGERSTVITQSLDLLRLLRQS